MLAMDSPRIKFAALDTNRGYFAVLSCLPRNKYRTITAFLRFSFRSHKQLRSTPEIISAMLRAKLWSLDFWTLSAGANEIHGWNSWRKFRTAKR
jgi:hypothetical protein